MCHIYPHKRVRSEAPYIVSMAVTFVRIITFIHYTTINIIQSKLNNVVF